MKIYANKIVGSGFGLLSTLVGVVIIAVIVVGGVLIYKHNNKTNLSTSAPNSYGNSSNTQTQTNDPYPGWKTALSNRAKFSIKYPSGWQYSQSIGDKDNIEHIRISSSKFQINIDSFNGKDPASGGTVETKCSDCVSAGSSETFSVPKFRCLKPRPSYL